MLVVAADIIGATCGMSYAFPICDAASVSNHGMRSRIFRGKQLT